MGHARTPIRYGKTCRFESASRQFGSEIGRQCANGVPSTRRIICNTNLQQTLGTMKRMMERTMIGVTTTINKEEAETVKEIKMTIEITRVDTPSGTVAKIAQFSDSWEKRHFELCACIF